MQSVAVRPPGYFLSAAPGEQQLGTVFADSLSFEGWFEPGTEAHARLLPIAEIADEEAQFVATER